MPVSASVTRMYSSVTSARPPKMPRGRLRCGSRTSSAEVATTSKPMNAKNTSAAPEITPVQPYWLGTAPVSQDSSGWVQASAPTPPGPASGGCAGGTKGEKFAVSM
ncbi:hypothetical protein D3C71_1715310 [compost metagenome]